MLDGFVSIGSRSTGGEVDTLTVEIGKHKFEIEIKRQSIANLLFYVFHKLADLGVGQKN